MDDVKPAGPAPEKQWDGVIFPVGFAVGLTHSTRINDACEKLEPLLKGGSCHIREIGGGRFLATPGCSATDKLLFTSDHPRYGQPRFTWVPGPDRTELGTLVEGA
jgi:hypothetical protein